MQIYDDRYMQSDNNTSMDLSFSLAQTKKGMVKREQYMNKHQFINTDHNTKTIAVRTPTKN